MGDFIRRGVANPQGAAHGKHWEQKVFFPARLEAYKKGREGARGPVLGKGKMNE